jgi:uncharacterized membrane protein YqjE
MIQEDKNIRPKWLRSFASLTMFLASFMLILLLLFEIVVIIQIEFLNQKIEGFPPVYILILLALISGLGSARTSKLLNHFLDNKKNILSYLAIILSALLIILILASI